MPTVYDVPAQDLIQALVEDLKKSKKIIPPEWASYVKTGSFKHHAPKQEDWWYIRCASILRKIYLTGPIGTSHLRKAYGGLKGKGTVPKHFTKASGAIIRKAMQQLESEGLVTSDRRGRSITPKGKSLLDKNSTKIVKEKYPELIKY